MVSECESRKCWDKLENSKFWNMKEPKVLE